MISGFVFCRGGAGQSEVVSGGAGGNRSGSAEPSRPGLSSEPAAAERAVAAGEGVADVTERLLAEFGTERDLATIAAVVLGCRAELAAVSSGALPELLERLARQRLQEHLPSAGGDIETGPAGGGDQLGGSPPEGRAPPWPRRHRTA